MGRVGKFIKSFVTTFLVVVLSCGGIILVAFFANEYLIKGGGGLIAVIVASVLAFEIYVQRDISIEKKKTGKTTKEVLLERYRKNRWDIPKYTLILLAYVFIELADFNEIIGVWWSILILLPLFSVFFLSKK
jgi:hypothetical protein